MSDPNRIRNLALALGVGAVAALIIDAVLRIALETVQSPGASSLTPWWAVGRVFERSVWVVLAVVFWAFAGTMGRLVHEAWPADHAVTRPTAFVVVGRLMVVTPLVWLLATWSVVVIRITLAGDWAIDGYMFLNASYYQNIVLAYLPWAAGGVALLKLSRHA